MRNKIKVLSLLLVLSIPFFFSFRGFGEDTKNEVLMQVIVQSLNSNHYDPYEINDDFSKRVFDRYLDNLDYGKRYFTQGDVDKMKTYEKKLDDQIMKTNYEFFDMSVELLDQRLAMINGIYKEILLQPFDFTLDEEINMDYEELDWAKDEAELRDRWRKVLKLSVLSRMATKVAVQDGLADADEVDEADASEEIMTMEEMEVDAREKVMKTYNDWERRNGKLTKNDRRAIFLNAVASTYDPHTSYYPPRDKENFDIQMSGRLEGIGATLQTKDGYVKIVSIVPGSPSYVQGDLKEDDLILKVAQGSEEPVDIVDMRLDDAVQLIRGKKGTEVRLTVKKLDGTVMVVPIIRDVVQLAETYAKSALIRNRNTGKHPVGYIKLPKFYADFQNKNGRRCATDVAKEIEKLKAENISGLVIDLRNNGGGSLMDVVEMAGLFIKEGPMVQVKGRYGEPQVLYDRDPEVQYDGPLAILVNSNSASASEILAAAIQDYQRGVIVGTPTYGKGTVQRFYGLNRFLKGGGTELGDLGSIKLTTQKFYRVNGGATQLKGVTPDVILPDAYTFIERGEKLLDFAMPWDEITPAAYDPLTRSMSTYGKVRSSSRERLKDNQAFEIVNDHAQRLKVNRDKKTRSLNLDTYIAENKKLKEESKGYKDFFEPIPGTEPSLAQEDQARIEGDSVLTRLNDDWFKGIGKDVYIDEAITIISDM